MFQQARAIVAAAERALGPLSDGMRRDLLKDNLPVSSDEARALVEQLKGE